MRGILLVSAAYCRSALGPTTVVEKARRLVAAIDLLPSAAHVELDLGSFSWKASVEPVTTLLGGMTDAKEGYS